MIHTVISGTSAPGVLIVGGCAKVVGSAYPVVILSKDCKTYFVQKWYGGAYSRDYGNFLRDLTVFFLDFQASLNTFDGCIRNPKLNGVDFGTPDLQVSTQPCSVNMEMGTFFRDGNSYVKMCKYRTRSCKLHSTPYRTRSFTVGVHAR